MVTVTIDGKKVSGKDGQTVLDLATAADIYIPTLCHHPKLAPFGACRMCLVKVEGMRNVVPACCTPVTEGMMVKTDDEELRGLRKNILSLILSEHPSGCIVCEDRELCFKYHAEPQKAGCCTGCKTCPNMEGCELYRVAERMGIKEIGVRIEYKDIPVKRDDPFMDRDYNICILCGRCVRVCDEIRGAGAIAFTSRSQKATIGTAFDKPLGGHLPHGFALGEEDEVGREGRHHQHHHLPALSRRLRPLGGGEVRPGDERPGHQRGSERRPALLAGPVLHPAPLQQHAEARVPDDKEGRGAGPRLVGGGIRPRRRQAQGIQAQ
jgi:hypothetical protein